MNEEIDFKYFKKSKMFSDVMNSFIKEPENHKVFMKYKDTPFQQVVDYRLNDAGLIGEDLVHNPDILALGCSVTLPVGLPHGLSWPHLIKGELNESVNVLAYQGASVQKNIYNATLHMMKYGVPKKIYFLIPSLDRAWIITQVKNPTLPKLSFKYIKDKNLSDLKYDKYYDLYDFFWINDANEYIDCGETNFLYKDFLNIKRSIPLEYGFQNQISSLINFFSFCKMVGIECFYYSWNAYFDNLLFENNILDDIAVHVKESNEHCYWSNQSKIDFDLSYFSSNIEHKKYWEKGLDKPEWNAHPGMYTHIHIAERFIGRKLSQKTIDEAKC